MSGAASPSGFAQKQLIATFQRSNASGPFATTGKDTVTIGDLRMAATVVQQAGYTQGALDLEIYGMTASIMNDLIVIQGLQPLGLEVGSTITLTAGPAGGTQGTVFRGAIFNAIIDYADAPDVVFRVSGIVAFESALKPLPPASYQGAADVALVMNAMADAAGLAFVNVNVTGLRLSNPYFPGSAYAQIEACARAAGIAWVVENDTLSIWNPGTPRHPDVIEINPQTGMVGYPTRTAIGVDFTMLYDPRVTFGSHIKLTSSVPAACGVWSVIALSHRLESQIPGGAWFSEVRTSRPDILEA